MKKYVGEIRSLFISLKNGKQRTNKTSIHLDTLGIISDKYHNTNTQRSVLITSLESYALAQNHNIEMNYGSLGENLLIDYNPYHLSPGVVLQIGTSKLEISQNCTICDHLSKIDERLPSLLEKDRGIFAKVLEEGEIKLGDKIYLVS